MDASTCSSAICCTIDWVEVVSCEWPDIMTWDDIIFSMSDEVVMVSVVHDVTTLMSGDGPLVVVSVGGLYCRWPSVNPGVGPNYTDTVVV